MANSLPAQSLLENAQAAVDLAKKLGADEVWASTSRSNGVSFEMRNGVLEKVEDSTSRGLQLRLWVNGRYSAHGTNDLRPETLQSFIKEAIAITRALQQDPYRVIPDPALFAGRSSLDLQLVDPSIASISREERIEMLKTMNDRIQGQEKVLSTTSSVSTSQSISADASSNGFSGSYEATSMFVSADVVLDEEGGKRPEEFFYGGGLHKSDVPQFEEEVTEFLLLPSDGGVAWCCGLSPIAKQEYSVLVDCRDAPFSPSNIDLKNPAFFVNVSGILCLQKENTLNALFTLEDVKLEFIEIEDVLPPNVMNLCLNQQMTPQDLIRRPNVSQSQSDQKQRSP